MARGLGGIMAEIAMADEAARLRDLETVPCPFCGREMDNQNLGSVWFCYGGPPHEGKCEHLPAIEDALGGPWNAQGQIVAAIIGDNGRPVVEVWIVRGGFGRSNIQLTAAGIDPTDVPATIAAGTWMFHELLIEQFA